MTKLTKRQQALEELETASRSIGHALSLLGGRTKYKPKDGPARSFIARQYMESLLSRLSVTTDLVMLGDGEIKLPNPEPEDSPYEQVSG